MLLALELGNVATYAYSDTEHGWSVLEPLRKHADIADFMRNQKGYPRIEPDRDSIPYNFGDWYGVDTFGANLASVTKNVISLDQDSYYWCRMLFATKYYAGNKPQSPNQVLLFTSKDGVPVYDSPDAFPRAWITHRVSTVSVAEAAVRMQSGGQKLRPEAFMFGASPVLESCGPTSDRATIVLNGINKQIFSVDAACRGLLIDADAYYPGWRATVDGNAAQLLEVYGALRGVVVPAGHHTVELRYRPRSVILGGLITLAGFIALGLLFSRWPKWVDHLP
jgi:hypothetical protein